MHIINQIILVNLLLPLLIFAFPQPQSDGGDEELDNRDGLFVVEQLCKTPTGEDLEDTSQCDDTLKEIIAEEKCECSEFEGHTCVKSDQCLDTPKQTKTASKAESQFVVFSIIENNSSISRPPWCEKSKQATCPNAGETCCKTKITKVEIVEPNTKCGQNRKNFECTPVQKCTSGHIEATQLDVVDIVRKIIHTGNTVVTKRKTAAKNESQFLVLKNIFDEFDDGFNGLLTGPGGAFDFGDEKDVVGQFKNTEEVVGITVNNKVTTCDVDIEICCETSITEDEPITTPPPPTTTT